MRSRALLGAISIAYMCAPVQAPAAADPGRTVPVTLAASHRGMPAQRSVLEFDFAPTHLAFSWMGAEGSGIRYRLRGTFNSGDRKPPLGAAGSQSNVALLDAEWSGWRRAPESHDAERGDVHYSAVIGVDRPKAVEWVALAHKGPVRSITVDYLNTVDGPRRPAATSRTAESATSKDLRTPAVVTRAEWGADESIKETKGDCDRDFYRVQQLFVHHTAGENFDENPHATMRAIYWYHVVRQGWCDLGYNFVIGWDGTVYEGRWARRYAWWEAHTSEDRSGRAVSGAHVADHNSGTVGVSLMGNFTGLEPPPAMLRSLAELLAWEVDRHDLKPRGKHTYDNPASSVERRLPYIAGHRDAGQTECPGGRLYRRLPELRRDVKRTIGSGKQTTELVLTPPGGGVSYGAPGELGGTLTEENGLGLASETITIYSKEAGSGWKLLDKSVTQADGSYSLSISPEANTRYAAFYRGNGTRWGDQTPDVKVKVHPAVTVGPQGGTPDASGVSHYPTGTTSVFLAGTVAPAHPGRNVRLTLYKLMPDGSYTPAGGGTARIDQAGRYSFEYLPQQPSSGTYQATAILVRHKDHGKGQSPTVTFVID